MTLKQATALVLFILLPGSPAFSAAKERHGIIELSDGTVVEGEISTTADRELKIHTGNHARDVAMDLVAEIRFTPRREELARNWRFAEAGQTRKEWWGDPYPVRWLDAEIVLRNNGRLRGHLYTTVLYARTGDKKNKIILYAKQKGKQGETLDSLVYVKRIHFSGTAPGGPGTVSMVIKNPDMQPGAELVAITRGSLVRLKASPAPKTTGTYALPPTLGEEVFTAFQSGNTIVVGWPAAENAELSAMVEDGLANIKDFFDRLELIGVYRPDSGNETYSLVMCSRTGKIISDKPQQKPWQLSVLRWKIADAEKRLMLCSRSSFFRGKTGPGTPAPSIKFSESLWNMKKDGNTWTANED